MSAPPLIINAGLLQSTDKTLSLCPLKSYRGAFELHNINNKWNIVETVSTIELNESKTKQSSSFSSIQFKSRTHRQCLSMAELVINTKWKLGDIFGSCAWDLPWKHMPLVLE